MLAALALLAVGCASANLNNGPPGDDEPPPDDAPVVPPDAPDVPVTETLAQATSPAIVGGNTLNCNTNDGVTVLNTLNNSYYRVFPLGSSGITDPFSVTNVTFGVESAIGTAGTQNVTVNIGTYGGTIAAGTTALASAQLSQLATAQQAITDGQSGMTVTTPITATIPANSNLYIEIVSVPSGNNIFFPGSNNGGESLPSFLKSADCGINEPTSYPAINLGVVNLVLSVTGSH